MFGRKSKLSRRNRRTIDKMCIMTVMACASPVFAHAAPTALDRLQVIQNKFCRSATDGHWCVRNSILHRDLELPRISKYSGISIIRTSLSGNPQPRNVLNDPPDALTAAVESLNDVSDTHD
ncbi:Probable RNA-directed DNA polymerase from transposon BS [Eumeta japonica]|uniref:Probable RNA-directed DNA polymerase from transposon BS n=1 Tax=Eumeta variegata TaxID=151549 RepID=A0A4C1WWP4_EUMVA|nr:Probable RNA-directed DNA polymerase from transposon BS [Eumeta japonica]